MHNFKIGDKVRGHNGYEPVEQVLTEFNLDRGVIYAGLQNEWIRLENCELVENAKEQEDVTDEEIHDYLYEEVDKFLDELHPNVFEEFGLDPYSDEGEEFFERVKKELFNIVKRRTQ